jgi:hypothetical protein
VATSAFVSGDLVATNEGSASVSTLMAGASETGRTRTLVGGLAGAGLLAGGVGGAFALRRRRPPGPPAYGPRLTDLGPIPDDSYATLGGPRPTEPAADEPAEPGRPEGDDVSQAG